MGELGRVVGGREGLVGELGRVVGELGRVVVGEQCGRGMWSDAGRERNVNFGGYFTT